MNRRDKAFTGTLWFMVSHPSDKNKNVARMGHPGIEAELRNALHGAVVDGHGGLFAFADLNTIG
jgi:hypothetical protein